MLVVTTPDQRFRSEEARFSMLTREEDVEISALRARGWTISQIARHTGRDRKTVRACLAGEREPGADESREPRSHRNRDG